MQVQGRFRHRSRSRGRCRRGLVGHVDFAGRVDMVQSVLFVGKDRDRDGAVHRYID